MSQWWLMELLVVDYLEKHHMFHNPEVGTVVIEGAPAAHCLIKVEA